MKEQATNDQKQIKTKYEFRAETKELLNIMISSLYTHREIFLRELISNASDALDKLHFKSLTKPSLLGANPKLEIILDIDKQHKTLTIYDNGIGMTHNEVIENIGTIAKSGSKAFLDTLQKVKSQNNIDLIGRFGVGFYSSFMVAEKVEIYTLAAGEKPDKGVYWSSKGDGTFSIKKTEVKNRGTKIILHLRKDCHKTDDPAEDFSNQYTVQNLVEKYSNYIKYPIYMDFYRNEYPRDKDGKVVEGAEPETTIDNKLLNSMTPLWKKDRKEIKTEDYFQFYKHQFHDWNEFADVIHFKLEGKVEFTALLFIPSKASSDLYDKDYSKGIHLYCNDVFVMKDCKDLLPDHLRFVRGLIDSPDFSLNISREILQHDAQLKIIGKNLEKKVIEALKKLLKNKREKYKEMWEDFGKAIKGGIYMEYKNKEKLQDLLLFRSSTSSDNMTTLEEYVRRMPEDQNEIYYAASKDIATIKRMPQLEIFREKNIETLFFTDKIDEFLTQNLDEYKGKKLISITREDFNLEKLNKKKEREENKENVKDNQSDNTREEHKELLECVKNHLGDKVKEVKISKRLISSPVCMVNTNSGVTFNMEQLLKGVNQPTAQAGKILEINPDHKQFSVLKKIYGFDEDSPEMKNCCEILYYQAMMMEGYELDDPVDFSTKIGELLISAYDHSNAK